MNKVMLIGRITAKPELMRTNLGVTYTKFNVAVNRAYKNSQGQTETDFIPVRVWRKQAENVCQYLDKGRMISVEGRLTTGSYQDKDGNKRYFTEVVADNVQFLESKKNGQQSGQVSDTQTPQSDTEDPFAEVGTEIQGQINIEDDNFLE